MRPWTQDVGEATPAPTLLPNFAAALQAQHEQRAGPAPQFPCPVPSFPCRTPHKGSPSLYQRGCRQLPKPFLEPSSSLEHLLLTVSLFLTQYWTVVPTPPYQMPSDQTVAHPSLKDPLCESPKHKLKIFKYTVTKGDKTLQENTSL